MLSCDTFALTRGRYAEGRNILAKNSDRPLGEAQPLRFFPAKTWEPGTMLQCTHLTIPQTEKTYAMLGCQPYWIWGFEMGVNECGLAIGNEAQGSRCEAETVEGLLGMDLLRLGLERAATAREAIDVITALLEQYGQNANANMLYDRRYENSFMLVDPREIWLLETAGRQWVARQVKDFSAISNCYSIEEDFDLCSAGAEDYARSRRWQLPSQPLNFAKAYTLPADRQRNSTNRWRRMQKLICAVGETMNEAEIKDVLRDHYEGELIEPRFGACYGGFTSICMHALTWDSSQTAASLIYSWDETLGHVCRYAPSLPCCSIYLPVYWTGELPASITLGEGTYSAESLWWSTERLAMAISIDEERFGEHARTALRELEEDIGMDVASVEQIARILLRYGEPEEARGLLAGLTRTAAEKLMTLAKTLADEICAAVRADGGLYGPRKEFLEAYCLRTGLPLD